MRETKYRAWDKENEVMVYSDDNPNDDFAFIVENDGLQFYYIDSDRHLMDTNSIKLQYTGLKDKNGTEIYEHDIIEIKNHPLGEGYNGTAKVYYDEKTMELCAGSFLLFRIRHHAKVIGNIYESELLEVTE